MISQRTPAFAQLFMTFRLASSAVRDPHQRSRLPSSPRAPQAHPAQAADGSAADETASRKSNEKDRTAPPFLRFPRRQLITVGGKNPDRPGHRRGRQGRQAAAGQLPMALSTSRTASSIP